MATPIRTTISGIGSKFPSKAPGDPTGMSLNTYGMDRLIEGVTGELISEILLEAIQPALEQAQIEWPKDTYASVDSMDKEVSEVGPKSAKVIIRVGGEQLINDERNTKHIDYAPFIEFNGTATVAPGVITHAMFANQDEMKEMIRNSITELIRDLLV